MAGFGSAFSQSFSQARSESAAKERDRLRMDYELVVRTADENVKKKQKDEADIRKAKEFAQMHSPGVPEAWRKYYGMIKGNMSDEVIHNWGEKHTLSVEDNDITARTTGAPVEGAGDITEAAKGAVGSQMEENGIKPPEDKGIFGDKWSAKRRAEEKTEMQTRVAKILGRPVEEITGEKTNEEVVAGDEDHKFTWKAKKEPFDIDKMYETGGNTSAEAGNWVLKAKEYAERTGDTAPLKKAEEMYNSVKMHEELAAGRKNEENFGKITSAAIFDPAGEFLGFSYEKKDGKWIYQGKEYSGNVVAEVDGSAKKLMNEAVGATKGQVEKHNKLLGNADEAINLISEANDILTENPDAIRIGSEWASGLEKIKENYDSIVDIFLEDPAKIDEKSIAKSLELENKLKDQLGEGRWTNIQRASLANKLMEAKLIRLSYMMAAASGQTGVAASTKDIEAFRQISRAGGNKAAWKQLMEDQLQTIERQIDISAQQTNDGPEFKLFKETHRYPIPVKPADDMATFYTKNEKTRTVREKFKSTTFTDTGSNRTDYRKRKVSPEEAQSEVKVPAGWEPTGMVSTDGRPVYENKNEINPETGKPKRKVF